jgi:hypothetical protein
MINPKWFNVQQGYGMLLAPLPSFGMSCDAKLGILSEKRSTCIGFE